MHHYTKARAELPPVRRGVDSFIASKSKGGREAEETRAALDTEAPAVLQGLRKALGGVPLEDRCCCRLV